MPPCLHSLSGAPAAPAAEDHDSGEPDSDGGRLVWPLPDAGSVDAAAPSDPGRRPRAAVADGGGPRLPGRVLGRRDAADAHVAVPLSPRSGRPPKPSRPHRCAAASTNRRPAFATASARRAGRSAGRRSSPLVATGMTVFGGGSTPRRPPPTIGRAAARRKLLARAAVSTPYDAATLPPDERAVRKASVRGTSLRPHGLSDPPDQLPVRLSDRLLVVLLGGQDSPSGSSSGSHSPGPTSARRAPGRPRCRCHRSCRTLPDPDPLPDLPPSTRRRSIPRRSTRRRRPAAPASWALSSDRFTSLSGMPRLLGSDPCTCVTFAPPARFRRDGCCQWSLVTTSPGITEETSRRDRRQVLPLPREGEGRGRCGSAATRLLGRPVALKQVGPPPVRRSTATRPSARPDRLQSSGTRTWPACSTSSWTTRPAVSGW